MSGSDPGLPDGCHSFAIRVYYEDTDAGGIVYHAGYLRFAERARTEFMRSRGFIHSALLEEHGVLLVVRRMSIDFRMPARLDDLLEVWSLPQSAKGAGLALEQRIMRGSPAGMSELVTMQVQLACVNKLGRPVRLPEALAAALSPTRPAPCGGEPGGGQSIV